MIKIRKVNTKKELKQFIQFYYDLYRGNENAVPFLYSDEMATLRRDKNPSFECCEAQYFLAYKDEKIVGRVAAIINRRANERWNCHQVRFGWFDFIDDMEVSTALLNAVEEWGRERGMTEIAGPLGFIDTDREGMLVEGFDTMATMHANHNFPYYQHHLERLGFKKDNDWIQQLVTIPDAVPEKMAKITQMIGKRYNLKAHKLTKKQLMGEYGLRFFHVLNECYKDLYEFSELTDKQIKKLVNDYLSIADLNLITFIFDENKKTEESPEGELVGFGVSFPSFSEALRKTKNGKLFPFGWWHLLRTLKWHNTDIVDLLLIGVLPEYRQKGANAILFDDLIRWYQKYGFKKALTLAMMETNDGVLSAWQYFEAKTVKRLRSYKKLIADMM
jgi:GNAT superfamily N-acetyltransferase